MACALVFQVPEWIRVMMRLEPAHRDVGECRGRPHAVIGSRHKQNRAPRLLYRNYRMLHSTAVAELAEIVRRESHRTSGLCSGERSHAGVVFLEIRQWFSLKRPGGARSRVSRLGQAKGPEYYSARRPCDDIVDVGECGAKQQREFSTAGFAPHRQKTISQPRLRPHPADSIPEIFKRNIDKAARQPVHAEIAQVERGIAVRRKDSAAVFVDSSVTAVQHDDSRMRAAVRREEKRPHDALRADWMSCDARARHMPRKRQFSAYSVGTRRPEL